ncbi:16S rRNA (cytidine(1402)-2'-O)-methyltransferase [Halomonas piscis]|uniref:16S rRNA (cytidine(1402)-2'-O)-methyltransferase n=1 Tax=Halomonas piscis TaxID=3031727 RepID=UPI002899F81C|nr:16S rRNA (cytidine(1402)-2'-O)-methyltransferase [Halomonas piscis]
MTQRRTGTLYVVATPIGNLDDLSARAAQVLGQVARVAAEDTRHSSRLLGHLGISVPMLSLHEHNEAARVAQLTQYLAAGEDVALISDAGTPLISDPGFLLVRELRALDYPVVPIPGPAALIAALSAAGLPTDRFRFGGFLPARPGARRQALETLRERDETLVFYESPHRIVHTLATLGEVMPGRHTVLARELTKTFETFLSGTPAELGEQLKNDANQARGEFVIMVEGAPPAVDSERREMTAGALLEALLAEGVGVKQGAAVAARLMGGRKQSWYAQLQALKES